VALTGGNTINAALEFWYTQSRSPGAPLETPVAMSNPLTLVAVKRRLIESGGSH